MRHLTTLALAGLFGGLLFSSDASACHKKAACACPPPAPVVCEPAPVVCKTPKVKHHFKMPKMSFHHKKATCAPVAYETYAAPMAPMATPQASGQGM